MSNDKKNPFGRALLFVLPGLAGFVAFYVWPFFISLYYSVLDRPVNGSFVGFGNYAALFANMPYRLGLRNTLVFMGISLPFNMIVSLAAALLIKTTGKRKPLFTLFFLIPLVVPSGSMIFFWRMLFSETGFLRLGFRVMESGYARIAVAVIFLWKNIGYNVILFLAGLSAVPKECLEAAKVDGAGAARRFTGVTLAFLAPTFVLVFMMSFINSFKVFKEVYLLTGGYPHESVYMLQHFMNNMFASLQYPKLTAATTTLVAGVALLTQALLGFERRSSVAE